LVPGGFEGHVVFTTEGATLCGRSNKGHLQTALRPRVAVMLVKSEPSTSITHTISCYDDLWDAKLFRFGEAPDDLFDVVMVERGAPNDPKHVVAQPEVKVAGEGYRVCLSIGNGGGTRLS
jgi:hypothetical protein